MGSASGHNVDSPNKVPHSHIHSLYKLCTLTCQTFMQGNLSLPKVWEGFQKYMSGRSSINKNNKTKLKETHKTNTEPHNSKKTTKSKQPALFSQVSSCFEQSGTYSGSNGEGQGSRPLPLENHKWLYVS